MIKEIIREMKESDIQACVDIIRRNYFSVKSLNESETFDEKSVSDNFKLNLSNGLTKLFVYCDIQDTVLGVAGITFLPSLFDSSNKKAFKSCLSADSFLSNIKQGFILRRLVDQMSKYADQKGIKTFIASSFINDNTSKLFKNSGFFPNEILFRKEMA